MWVNYVSFSNSSLIEDFVLVEIHLCVLYFPIFLKFSNYQRCKDPIKHLRWSFFALTGQ